MQQSTVKVLKQVILHCQNIIKKNNHIECKVNKNRIDICLNRPSRLNAFSLDMYIHLTKLIQQSNNNNAIKFIVISGNGGNFSSGNDLNNFSSEFMTSFNQNQAFIVTSIILQRLGNAIINSNKPIFGLVEGKVIGFAFTQLMLYDGIYAVQNCQFIAPLVRTAQGPQMCSSYTFPKIFGKMITQKLIVLGQKVSPVFLQKYGLMSVHKTRLNAEQALQARLNSLSQLDWSSYIETRKLMLEPQRKILLQVNKKQVENLVVRWMNPQLPNILIQHMSQMKQKSKL